MSEYNRDLLRRHQEEKKIEQDIIKEIDDNIKNKSNQNINLSFKLID